MKRAVIPIALAALLLAALAPAAAAPRSKTVKVDDNFFAPDSLSVKKGATVRFKWVGEREHNVVKSTGPGRYFQSDPMTGDGVLYKHRFKKAGRYKLVCSLHNRMKMSLRVKRGSG